MPRMKMLLLLANVLLLHLASGAHILSLGYPGGSSHHYIQSKIGTALSQAGHTFTFLVSDMDEGVTQPKEEITKLIYPSPYTKDYFLGELEKISEIDPLSGTKRFIELQVDECKSAMRDSNIWKYLESNPVDLILGDNVVDCVTLFAEKLDVPIIGIAPVAFYDPLLSEIYGIPTPPAYIPMMGTNLGPVMNFGERIINLLNYVALRTFSELAFAPIVADMSKDLGFDKPFDEMKIARTELLLVTTSVALEYPRPLPPFVKLVGSVLAAPAVALPEELDQWMRATGKRDVVYVSFGTISRPSQQQQDRLVQALALLTDTRVLWKLVPGMPLTETPVNFRVEAWVGQNDVLGHPATAAFLTHAGMNSATEAVYHGVPTIAFPMFADQFDNSQRLVNAGMGEVLPRDGFTPASGAALISRVLAEESYRQSASRVSGIAKEEDGVAGVVAWVDYYLRHGSQHLKVPQTIQLPWYSLWMLDALAVIFVFIFGAIFSLKLVCGALYSVLFGKKMKRE